jgi:hypothetical protein
MERNSLLVRPTICGTVRVAFCTSGLGYSVWVTMYLRMPNSRVLRGRAPKVLASRPRLI